MAPAIGPAKNGTAIAATTPRTVLIPLDIVVSYKVIRTSEQDLLNPNLLM
jgi:hypothetical protein